MPKGPVFFGRVIWLLAYAACAPTVDSPTERARTADREDATHLAQQLRSLPGATAAEVMLRRPTRDPFTGITTKPYASAAILVDSPAHQNSAKSDATRLIRAAVPEVDHPEVLVGVAVTRPTLAHVGPFQVSSTSRSRLMATLIIGLTLIATLAGYIAWRTRRRTT